MSAAQWSAVALFAFVSSITPGPNNLLATASGARFGLRRTLPQIAGVTFGFTLLLAIAASGVASVVAEHPGLARLLTAFGFGYLLWLSFTLLAAAVTPTRARPSIVKDRPMRFLESTLFQFANPKAWMMALSVASSFLVGEHRSISAAALLALLFAAINFPCVGAWAALGARLQRWLHEPSQAWRLRAFNASMGGTLLLSTAGMIALR